MTSALHMVGSVLIAGGLFFMVTGAIGVMRMPDVFTRQHAAGMTDTAGAGLILLGMMFFGSFPVVIRLVAILVFLLFTSPIATYAVCRAALHAGVAPLLGDDAGRGD
jgi:multicomponent Na+:H+ antiporter subunit G